MSFVDLISLIYKRRGLGISGFQLTWKLLSLKSPQLAQSIIQAPSSHKILGQ